MPKKQVKQSVEPEIDWVEGDLPNRGTTRSAWWSILNEVMKRPGVWARVKICDTSAQANQAQSNLTQRKIKIPNTEDNWSFAARENEVYAVYRGKKPPRSTRTRNKTSARVR